MGARKAPQTVEDFTLEALWDVYREGNIPNDLDPDNFVLNRCREAFYGGALFLATVWLGLEKRADVSAVERVAASARFVSEGEHVLANMDLPEALQTRKQ